MANEQNLIKFTSNQNREEASKNGKKGGVRSGEVRRQRKAMKEQLNMLLSLPLENDKLRSQIKRLGIADDDIDNQLAMNVSLFQEALKGNMRAVEIIRDTIGEKPQDNINLTGEVNNPYTKLSDEELRKIAEKL